MSSSMQPPEAATHTATEAAPAPLPWTFSIQSLLLLTLLVAVWLSITLAVPWLGVPSLIILPPALLRTAMVVRRRQHQQRAVSGGGVIVLFCLSVGFVVVVLIAGIYTFLTILTFLAILLMPVLGDWNGVIPSILVGLIVAAIISINMIRRHWYPVE